MGQFLRHVRIVALPEIAGAQSTDVILSLCYAKTVHGRLLQQFGVLEGEGGRAMLLDALALCDRHLDIVSAFDESDLDDERLHQPDRSCCMPCCAGWSSWTTTWCVR